MAMPPASAITVCSTCGELLNANGDCLACLLRVGLEEANTETGPPVSLAFGDFEVEQHPDGSYRELGRGAMGVTYLARDRVLQRRVALKVIEVPETAAGSQTVRERFLREARPLPPFAIRMLRPSSNLARPQMALAAITPWSWSRASPRGANPQGRSTKNKTGLGNRDSNHAGPDGRSSSRFDPSRPETRQYHADTRWCRRTRDGRQSHHRPRQAHRGGRRRDESTRGGFVNTPNFASPEQFGRGQVDARSDIYSLGATLWFALAGLAPRSGSTIEEIRDHLACENLPVEQLVTRKVPRPLGHLLRSTLAVDPAQRPASARELMAALESCRRKIDHRIPISYTVAALIALVALIVATLFVLRPGARKTTIVSAKNVAPSGSVSLPEKSIAVLPFCRSEPGERSGIYVRRHQ